MPDAISEDVADDLARELAVARRAAIEAGAAALGMQAGVRSESKSDGSPVSAGDVASHHIIAHTLQQHFPDDSLLSEESDADASGGRTWIIDPIDGTSGYISGGDAWCVQIALAIDGVARVGVVDLPGLGVRILGVVGVGAWIEDADGARPLQAPNVHLNHLVTSASSRNRKLAESVVAALPGFAWTHVHSVGVKIWHLLSGRADLYVHARPIAAWDAAAPAAVLEAAGGRVSDLRGRALRLGGRNQPCPGMVGSVRSDHDRLLAGLPLHLVPP